MELRTSLDRPLHQHIMDETDTCNENKQATQLPPSSIAPSSSKNNTAATTINNNKNNKTSRKRNINMAARDALAGAAAGSFAKTAVAPIERVKLLLQLKSEVTISTSNNMNNNNNNSARMKNMGAIEVAMRVYREQGLLAFWRGASVLFFVSSYRFLYK